MSGVGELVSNNKRKLEKRDSITFRQKKTRARALVSLQEEGAAFTKTEETAAEAAAGKAFIHPRRSPDRPLLNKRKKKRRQRERDRRIPVIREKSIKSSALGKG